MTLRLSFFIIFGLHAWVKNTRILCALSRNNCIKSARHMRPLQVETIITMSRRRRSSTIKRLVNKKQSHRNSWNHCVKNMDCIAFTWAMPFRVMKKSPCKPCMIFVKQRHRRQQQWRLLVATRNGVAENMLHFHHLQKLYIFIPRVPFIIDEMGVMIDGDVTWPWLRRVNTACLIVLIIMINKK